MSVSGLLSDKFAIYMSQMSPLAAKIYDDVKAIDHKIPPNITYNEKCYLVDKYLIYDLINNKPSSSNYNSTFDQSEGSLDLLDKEVNEIGLNMCYGLEHDHISSLLLSIYPKKPDKYVYDDSNCWVDEHSVAYSCCTQSQIKSCTLEQLVKAIPILDSLQKQPSSICHKKHKAPMKPSAVDFEIENKIHFKEEYNPDYITEDVNEDINEILESCSIEDQDLLAISHSTSTKKTIGVSVMGMFSRPSSHSQPSSLTASKKQQSEKNTQQFQENLPQQKQNLDLIAELQAKLMNKSECTSGSAARRGGSKIHKPKAPPPPPPPKDTTGTKVKVTEDKSTEPKLSENTNEFKKIKGGNEISEDDFIVDISSPCRIATPKTGLDFLDNW